VHKAVLASKDKESGITIHQVNQDYDKGKVIFQATCPIVSGDTPETLAARIHELEYLHYPRVIEELLLKDDDED
jgi:phosphoribosylglycinamide formyltransferase-1